MKCNFLVFSFTYYFTLLHEYKQTHVIIHIILANNITIIMATIRNVSKTRIHQVRIGHDVMRYGEANVAMT